MLRSSPFLFPWPRRRGNRLQQRARDAAVNAHPKLLKAVADGGGPQNLWNCRSPARKHNWIRKTNGRSTFPLSATMAECELPFSPLFSSLSAYEFRPAHCTSSKDLPDGARHARMGNEGRERLPALSSVSLYASSIPIAVRVRP